MNTQTLTTNNTQEVVSTTAKCDSCNAQGAYVATKGSVKLTFCAHHVRSHEASLIERNFTIIPETYKF